MMKKLLALLVLTFSIMLQASYIPLTGGTASDVNRITLSSDTLTNLNGLTNRAGTLYYNTTSSNIVFDNGATLSALSDSNTEEASTLDNAGLATSVGSSALTVALKQSDGSTDPSTGASAVRIGFRSSTATSGATNIRTVTSSLSLVVPSGATLGFRDATAQRLFIYAIDNAGTVELAVSGIQYEDGSLVTTVALSAGADSIGVIYSTTLRSNVPVRMIGFLDSTQTTAGTWASAGTTLFVGISGLIPKQDVLEYYSSDSGQAVTNGNTVVYEDVEISTHGLYNISTGVFTADSNRMCQVCASIATNSVAYTAGNAIALNLLLNSASFQRIAINRLEVTRTDSIDVLGCSRAFKITTGDTLLVQFSETVPAVNLSTTSTINQISFKCE